MDKQFDELSKSLAQGVSRREALKKIGLGLGGGLLASFNLGRTQEAAAQSALKDRDGFLVVGSFGNNAVICYDQRTGALVRQFDPFNLGNLVDPIGGVFGPDGNLFVTSDLFVTGFQSVLEYHGRNGKFKRLFASENIVSPRGVLFGPDHKLYVANGSPEDILASVLRFDGKTGAFLDYFVAPTISDYEHPSYMVFGPDGSRSSKLDLYIADAVGASVLRFDGSSGAFKGVFVAPGSGGLNSPQNIVFDQDGSLLVASGNWFSDSDGTPYPGDFPPGAVLRFEGPAGRHPGAFLGTFIPGGYGGLANPCGMIFGPQGDLFVASCVLTDNLVGEPGTNQVLRYHGKTGAFKGAFVAPDSGGLNFPTFLTFTETDPTTLNYNQ